MARRRVWEDFLTDQDRALLEMRARPVVPIGFGERCAVISIDNYRYAAGDRPLPILEAVKEWPGSMGLAAWEALEKISGLLESAREASVPIAHVTGLSQEESGISPRLRFHRRESLAPHVAQRYPEFYDFVDQAAPRDGEVVLKKLGASAFWSTPLVGYLIEQRVDTVILIGESTSGCVRASMIDATAYRFRTIVVEDCVYDRFEASHAMSLFDMSQKGCDIVESEDVIAHFASL